MLGFISRCLAILWADTGRIRSPAMKHVSELLFLETKQIFLLEQGFEKIGVPLAGINPFMPFARNGWAFLTTLRPASNLPHWTSISCHLLKRWPYSKVDSPCAQPPLPSGTQRCNSPASTVQRFGSRSRHPSIGKSAYPAQ